MFFFIGYFLLITDIQAQTLDEAKKLYAEGKYSDASPFFENACKSSPQNASYNLWYGTCLLETGKMTKAVDYLKFAASKNIPEAYSSLGKLYYLSYKFEESVESYRQCTQLLIKNKQQSEANLLKPLIERSERAARMLTKCEDVRIIDSIVIDKKNFLNTYFISREAGYLDSKGESMVYENPLKNKRCFAKKDKTGKFRIFSEIKLQDKWGEEKELSIPADSLGDDNYPFVLQDGITIYYASTGNGSIGGYDLFITRHNSSNDTYLAPAQLGMPFNSIYNDYMMVIDENNSIGYFATDRFQTEGKVIIYTFIPNEEMKYINLDNNEQLISRAKIASIRDTWEKGTDYKAYISEYKKIVGEELNRKKKDFFFAVNDNTVYYTLDDFVNVAAKQAFLKAQELEKQIKTQEKDLEDLRIAYSKGDEKYRKSISSAILYRENHLPELREQYRKALINVRSLEIKHVKKI
jgi:TolA-binding protein